jgi:hypothetical protein
LIARIDDLKAFIDAHADELASKDSEE